MSPTPWDPKGRVASRTWARDAKFHLSDGDPDLEGQFTLAERWVGRIAPEEIEGMGGEVAFRSSPSTGTVFHIDMPIVTLLGKAA